MPFLNDRDKDSLDLRLLFQLVFWILLSVLFLSLCLSLPSSTPRNSPFVDLEVRNYKGARARSVYLEGEFLNEKAPTFGCLCCFVGEGMKGERERRE